MPNRSSNYCPVPDDGKWLASADFRSAVKVWDITQRRETWSFSAHEDPRSHEVGVKGAAFAADSRTLITGGIDGMIRFWDVVERCEAAPLKGGIGKIRALALSQDRRTLAIGSAEHFDGPGGVRLFDVEKREALTEPVSVPSGVSRLIFSADGNWLLAGTVSRPQGMIKLWRTSDLIRSGRKK